MSSLSNISIKVLQVSMNNTRTERNHHGNHLSRYVTGTKYKSVVFFKPPYGFEREKSPWLIGLGNFHKQIGLIISLCKMPS